MTATPSLHILVVEDNDSLREATVDFLQSHGHLVTGVVCAEEVDDTPTHDLPELYLIDVNLPGEDGFSLSERIRKCQPLAGIVLMTARGQVNDRLEGYSSGADNYLVKPVEQAEMLACVNNLARRIKVSAPTPMTGLVLNQQTHTLTGPQGYAALSHGESVLLAAFSRAAGKKLQRWQAMQLVDTKNKGPVPAHLEMRISAFRTTLHSSGAPDDAIRTLRGYGYALGCQIEIL